MFNSHPDGSTSATDSVVQDDLPLRLSEKDYTSENTYYLLNDDEPSSVYFSPEQRSFYVNQPLQVTFEEGQYLQLRFYSPREISNVTVWANIDGYDEDFKLLELEKVQPFQQLRVPLPFASKDMTALARNGNKIKIMANPHLSAANLSFKVECDDPYYQKLVSNRCKWNISFSGYSGQGNWSKKLLPAHAREAVAIALNMTYMFGTPEFERALMEFGPLHSNNNRTVIDKAALLKKTIEYPKLVFGHCFQVNGLGSPGGTFGLAEWCFLEHYADDTFETHTIFHEFGHCLGYGHDGNMTYEVTGPGWISLCHKVYQELSLNKQLPVYSRRFMHTRKNPNRYDKTNFYAPSKHVIEGPELDVLDGGISPIMGKEDQDDDSGEAVSLDVVYTAVPGATEATFSPRAVYCYGDELYVANGANGHFSLEIFGISNGKVTHRQTISKWQTADGREETFSKAPNGVVRYNGKIYVTHEGSRTEIFDAETKAFVTRIGNGSWGEGAVQTVHAYDVVGYRGLVFIRDKRKVVAAEEKAVKTGSTVAIYARSENLGESAGIYGMAVDAQSQQLYATHQHSKRVDIFDLTQVREGSFKKKSSFSCESKPYDVDFSGSRLFVSFEGNRNFCEVNPQTGQILKDYSAAAKNAVEKFCIRRNTLFAVSKDHKHVYAFPMSTFQ